MLVLQSFIIVNKYSKNINPGVPFLYNSMFVIKNNELLVQFTKQILTTKCSHISRGRSTFLYRLEIESKK